MGTRLGIADSAATVSINSFSSGIYRKGQYYQKSISVSNGSVPVWQSVSVTTSGGGSVPSGNVFIAKTPETPTTPYDLDGNLLQDGRWDYTWDSENRLIQMQSRSSPLSGSNRKLEFEYDYMSRRIKKKVTDLGTSTVLADFRFVYDGWNMVGEMNSSLSLQRSYLWGLDLSGSEQGAGGVSGLIAVRQHSDSTSHFAAFDGNGDVGGLVGVSDGTTTGDGAITAVYEYGPFGEPLRTTGDYAKNNPFRFSTKFTDNESGLVYYGYRYYNQSTGRWLSRDPVEEQGFKTTFVNKKSTVLDQVNLFFFVGNVPLSAIDADGLIANWIAGCGVGCVVGGIGGAIGGIGGGIKSIKCGALGGAVSGCCLGIVGQTPLAPWASCACGLIGGVVEQMCSGSVTDPCAIASIVASTAMGCLGPATDMLGGKHKIVEAITGVIIGAGGPVCSGIKGL